MRKIIVGIFAVAICVSVAIAEMSEVTIPVNDLKPAAAQTNSYVLRGEIRALEMFCATPSSVVTATVSVVYNGATILSKSFTNSSVFYPMVNLHGNTGTALSSGDITNTVCPTYGYMSVAGIVTQTVTGVGAATNDWVTKIVFK
jgi:hypothetical protein